jgi:hypothetical protein
MVLLALLVRLVPVLTTGLLTLVAPVLILWLIVAVLRSIVTMLLP